METLLYRELVPWYRLLDPTADHSEEATCYLQAIERASTQRPQSLLELGAGAGNNAAHLKGRLRCTLTDASPEMLELSRALNPECEHLLGDMRTLRLVRTFDAVLVHDAVMYMTNENDLRAVAETAFVHTRSGGVALFVPDCVRETFHEETELHEGEEGARALRCLSWTWDPDPSDTTFVTEYAFLLREGAQLKAVHDRHVEGLFPRATWQRLLGSVGYNVESAPTSLGEGESGEMFVCRKP
jgi:SAM-dependent methyltransferase